LLGWVQPFGAGMSAVLDGVAPVELELIVDGVQSLLGELITAVLYPPGKIVDVYGTQHLWEDKHVYQHQNVVRKHLWEGKHVYQHHNVIRKPVRYTLCFFSCCWLVQQKKEQREYLFFDQSRLLTITLIIKKYSKLICTIRLVKKRKVVGRTIRLMRLRLRFYVAYRTTSIHSF
jgi:hypothetical protein